MPTTLNNSLTYNIQYQILTPCIYNGILGRDFLSKYNATVNLAKNSLYFDPSNIATPASFSPIGALLINKFKSSQAVSNKPVLTDQVDSSMHLTETTTEQPKSTKRRKRKNKKLRKENVNLELTKNDSQNRPVSPKSRFNRKIKMIPCASLIIALLFVSLISCTDQKPRLSPLYNCEVSQHENLFKTLSGSVFFNCMNLRKRFWQIPVTARPQSFIPYEGFYQFKHLPFGLPAAPSLIQRLMKLAPRHLNWKICLLYLDDENCLSKSFPEHLKLERIFQVLKKENLEFKPPKYIFAKNEVSFLRQMIRKKSFSSFPEKKKLIKGYKAPKLAKQVKQFIGLANYYHHFVPNFPPFRYSSTQKNRRRDKNSENQIYKSYHV